MANRHLLRSLAMQALFEWDFNNLDNSALPDIIRRLANEFAYGVEDLSFALDLVNGVISRLEQLDKVITKAAPDWPIEQIAVVDRNILRLGLYELLFGNTKDVPARVAINEAIELAKTFGGENSGRFANGVLGAIYKEIGEPDKDDIPAKLKKKDIPYDQMEQELLAGAVVFHRQDDGSLELALVHDIFGYWTLSKGHVEEGETLEDTAIRELKEETSLDIEIKDKLGDNEYIATDPERGKIRKKVSYFLAEAKNPAGLELASKEGLDKAKWFPISEISDLKIYDDILPIITNALKKLV